MQTVRNLDTIAGLRLELHAAKWEGRADDARAIIAKIKTLREG